MKTNKQPKGIDPGVYDNLAAEDYHADTALSSSGLKTLLDNPVRYWYESALNPKRVSPDTPTLKNSRAFHCMLLEPENFAKEFSIKKGCKSSSVAGMVGEGDYQSMIEAASAIRQDDSISALLTGGKPEVSIFWEDQETGIMCRVRFDYLRPLIGFDYKTIRNISLESIAYAIADYGYDVSAAMYMEGLKQAGLYEKNHLGFVLLFQEKEAPYLFRAVHLSNEIMEIGHRKFREGVHEYAYHIKKYGTEKWSPETGGVIDIGLENMPYKYKN